MGTFRRVTDVRAFSQEIVVNAADTDHLFRPRVSTKQLPGRDDINFLPSRRSPDIAGAYNIDHGIVADIGRGANRGHIMTTTSTLSRAVRKTLAAAILVIGTVSGAYAYTAEQE